MLHTKGFTLLELLVVMAITAVLTALGVYGMSFLRQTIVLEGAAQELVANLTKAQNLARNSVLRQTDFQNLQQGVGSNPLDSFAGYALVFSNSSYQLNYCSFVGSSKQTYDCQTVVSDTVKAAQYVDVVVSVTPVECSAIIFSRLEPNILNMNDTIDVPLTGTQCQIELRLGTASGDINKVITVDTLYDTINAR